MPPVPFHPAAPAFLRPNALYLAHASDIAYHRAPAPAALERLALTTVLPFRHKLTRTRGFLGLCDTHAVLAFRGTEPANLPNWITDATFSLAAPSDIEGRVHTGFSKALASIWPKLTLLLPRAANLPLYLTGHSMGGAIAKLAACRLARAGTPAAATYTYGAPRFGDAAFCAAYALPTYRLVNRMDLVPELPLAGFRKLLPNKPKWTNERILARLHDLADRLPTYAHVKTQIHITNDNTLTIDSPTPRWHAAAIAEALATKGKPFLTGVTDHLLGNYIRSLESSAADHDL